jgi:hypothetical protein
LPPSHLSANFKRFFTEFEHNIDFILKYEYEVHTLLRMGTVNKVEQFRLESKYKNLLAESKKMCHKFTGPHSVL